MILLIRVIVTKILTITSKIENDNDDDINSNNNDIIDYKKANSHDRHDNKYKISKRHYDNVSIKIMIINMAMVRMIMEIIVMIITIISKTPINVVVKN